MTDSQVTSAEDSASDVRRCKKCTNEFRLVSLERELYKKLGVADPDYCPIGLVNNIKIDTINFNGWDITVDLGFLIAEILAHPDYVGGINKARYRVVDPPTNILVGTTQVISGSVLTVENIRSSLGSVLLQVQVDADFDPGTGTHTVRHELNLVINLPAYGPITTSLDTNSYICIDLG